MALIDNEDESQSELDVVEEQQQEKQLPEVTQSPEFPEKYREKTLEEVIKMHQEVENPKEAIRQTVDNHPDVVAGRQAAHDFKRMQIQQKLTQEHPDYGQVASDPDFANWVKSSPIRINLFAKADGEFDYDSANELLTTYKQLRGIKAKQTSDAGEATRKTNLKAASVDVGGSGESGKRVYRRADLIRLKMTDPNRYEALSDEIMQAYAEGRVK
jgi:hypothetical protein